MPQTHLGLAGAPAAGVRGGRARIVARVLSRWLRVAAAAVAAASVLVDQLLLVVVHRTSAAAAVGASVVTSDRHFATAVLIPENIEIVIFFTFKYFYL